MMQCRQFLRFSSSFRIKDLKRTHLDQSVTVKVCNSIKQYKYHIHNLPFQGWVKNVRNMKENLFVDLNDGSCAGNVQVVVSKEAIKSVNFGASVETSGVVALSPREQLEIKATDFKVLGDCPPLEGFPFAARHSYPPEYIREHLQFRSRVSSFNSMLRVRNSAQLIINQFLNQEKFIRIDTPILTANDCEGGGETFSVRPDNAKLLKEMQKEGVALEESFFDRKIFLTVSGQLHLEAMAHGAGDCYTFGPTFRAENAKSPVHLSEFYMLEVEQCFIPDLSTHLSFVEKFINEVTGQVLESSPDDIANCQKQNKGKEVDFAWVGKEIPILTYKEAAEIVEANKGELKVPFVFSEGLAKDHELFLCRRLKSPVFIVDWPIEMKPFYMRQNLSNPSLADAYDLLVPNIGELIGGSAREDNYEKLVAKIPEGLEWYSDLRKYGGIPTAGFGMGFERYLQMILNVHNIRDVIPYPRYPHSCTV